MKRVFALATFALSLMVFATAAAGQGVSPTQDKASKRNDTRDKLRLLLETAGKRKDVNVVFTQSTKQPYNFTGTIKDGLTTTDSLEVIVSVTEDETIGFRVYPHYKGQYINVERAKNPNLLMRQLLNFSDRNFLFWGVDQTGDSFAGYTFTLESGFPYEALLVVLRSIKNTDRFVGEIRAYIDGGEE